MKHYLAPMEEITTFVFRNALTEMFGAPDKCFAPFITPMEKRLVRTREKRDVAPENNGSIVLVPQVLTKDAGAFFRTVQWLYGQGYREINFNLGCPSGTVVSKGKGSGFLKDPILLEKFFREVFETIRQTYGDEVSISVKTRIGFEAEDEFFQICDVLAAFPFSEIIIHPRLRSDLYAGPCHMGSFSHAVRQLPTERLVYNGDLFSVDDVRRFSEAYPEVRRVMFGRGVVANPALIREMRTGEALRTEEVFAFCERLYRDYCDLYSGEKDAVFKLKEVWTYLSRRFDGKERLVRNILKAKNPADYREAVARLREGVAEE